MRGNTAKGHCCCTRSGAHFAACRIGGRSLPCEWWPIAAASPSSLAHASRTVLWGSWKGKLSVRLARHSCYSLRSLTSHLSTLMPVHFYRPETPGEHPMKSTRTTLSSTLLFNSPLPAFWRSSQNLPSQNLKTTRHRDNSPRCFVTRGLGQELSELGLPNDEACDVGRHPANSAITNTS